MSTSDPEISITTPRDLEAIDIRDDEDSNSPKAKRDANLDEIDESMEPNDKSTDGSKSHSNDGDKDNDESNPKLKKKRNKRPRELDSESDEPKKKKQRSDIYAVEAINAWRYEEGECLFSVKWQGWDEPTLEPIQNVAGNIKLMHFVQNIQTQLVENHDPSGLVGTLIEKPDIKTHLLQKERTGDVYDHHALEAIVFPGNSH
eukprot:335665_1